MIIDDDIKRPPINFMRGSAHSADVAVVMTVVITAMTVYNALFTLCTVILDTVYRRPVQARARWTSFLILSVTHCHWTPFKRLLNRSVHPPKPWRTPSFPPSLPFPSPPISSFSPLSLPFPPIPLPTLRSRTPWNPCFHYPVLLCVFFMFLCFIFSIIMLPF